MTIWRAFRGSVLWAVVVTAVLWGLAVVLSIWPAGDGSSAGQEELPPLSPGTGEIVVLGLSVVMTFAVVLTVIVAVSLLRRRTAAAPRGR